MRAFTPGKDHKPRRYFHGQSHEQNNNFLQRGFLQEKKSSCKNYNITPTQEYTRKSSLIFFTPKARQ